ncbi:MAG: hypothetical protein AB7U44_10030 [Sulfuricurvum sp.]
MYKIKYLALTSAIVLITSQQSLNSAPIQENEKYQACKKECKKYPKVVSLFKDGFHQPISYDPIYDLNGEHVLLIEGSQGSEKSKPQITLFFKEIKWVNKILFNSSDAVEQLLQSLEEIEKDWTKIPANSNKKYKPYYNSAQGMILPQLFNTNGVKVAIVFVSGKYSVDKVSMTLDEEGIKKITSTIKDLKEKLKNKYSYCIDSCYSKHVIGRELSEAERWNREVDRERGISD